MLRAEQFLPSQLRAAWLITRNELQSNDTLTNRDLLSRWFGDARAEFLPGAPARTPLVNNITAAAAYTDQHGRVYAYADPSDYEPDPEPDTVPVIEATDCLFVAIPNRVRQRANDYEQSVSLDAVRLPEISEELYLWPINGHSVAMTVEVVEMYEPSDENARVSSGFIRISGWLHTKRVNQHARFEALMRDARR